MWTGVQKNSTLCALVAGLLAQTVPSFADEHKGRQSVVYVQSEPSAKIPFGFDFGFSTEQKIAWLRTCQTQHIAASIENQNSSDIQKSIEKLKESRRQEYVRFLCLKTLTQQVVGLEATLLVLPYDDPSKVFLRPEIKYALHTLKKTNNFTVVFAETEDDVIRALDPRKKYTRAIICGHGYRKGIVLGTSGIADPQEQHYELDLSDKSRLAPVFARCKTIKRIDLISCSVAEGESQQDNVVNMISECAPGVVVTGPMKVAMINRLYVDSKEGTVVIRNHQKDSGECDNIMYSRISKSYPQGLLSISMMKTDEPK